MPFISNSFGTILNRWPCQLYVGFLQNYVLFPNWASHWLCFICKSLNCLVSGMFYYKSLHSIPFYFLPIWIDLNFPLENQFHPFSLRMRECLFNHSFEYVPKPFVFCCMRVRVCAFVCVLKLPSSSHSKYERKYVLCQTEHLNSFLRHIVHATDEHSVSTICL